MADQLDANVPAKAGEETNASFKSFADFEKAMEKEEAGTNAAGSLEDQTVRPASAIADAPPVQKADELDKDGNPVDDENLTPEQIAAAEKAALKPEPTEAEKAAAAAAAKGPEKIGLKGRLGQLVREKHEEARARTAAEQRAEAAETALAAERAGKPAGDKPTAKAAPNPNQPAPVTSDRPKAEDFEFGEYDPKYQDAVVEWKVEQSLAARDAKVAQTAEADAVRRTEAERTQRWGGTIEKGAAKNADFEAKVLSGDTPWKLSKQMWEMSVDSEVGHDVLYHLASNPAESDRIFALSLTRQAAEFGALEARFSQPLDGKSKSEVKDGANGHMPSAPKPMSSVRGAGGQYKTDAGTKDFAAFEAMMKAEEAARLAKQ